MGVEGASAVSGRVFLDGSGRTVGNHHRSLSAGHVYRGPPGPGDDTSSSLDGSLCSESRPTFRETEQVVPSRFGTSHRGEPLPGRLARPSRSGQPTREPADSQNVYYKDNIESLWNFSSNDVTLIKLETNGSYKD